MEILKQGYRFQSVKVQDDLDGYIGVKVLRDRSGEQIEVARVIFWDATGEIVLSVLVDEIPIEVAETAAGEVRKLAGLSK